MEDADETLDIVDNQDNVIGTVRRDESFKAMKSGGNLRAAEMYIINDKGELWIPRRQTHKKIAPGGLDFSASGHVSSGEDYETSLYREAKEELNLDIDKSKLEFLQKFPPAPGMAPFFRKVYLYHSNDTPDFNKDDFSEAFWVKPADVLQMLKAGEPAKQSLTETIEYLVSNLGTRAAR
jgi:isopentenyldiphosphate isomerase